MLCCYATCSIGMSPVSAVAFRALSNQSSAHRPLFLFTTPVTLPVSTLPPGRPSPPPPNPHPHPPYLFENNLFAKCGSYVNISFSCFVFLTLCVYSLFIISVTLVWEWSFFQNLRAHHFPRKYTILWPGSSQRNCCGKQVWCTPISYVLVSVLALRENYISCKLKEAA